MIPKIIEINSASNEYFQIDQMNEIMKLFDPMILSFNSIKISAFSEHLQNLQILSNKAKVVQLEFEDNYDSEYES